MPTEPAGLATALACLFVLSVVPTNAYLLGWRLLDLSRHDYPYYLRQDETHALDWLMTNSSPTDVVLSSLTVGQYVPSVSGNQAFLAHWAETLDYYTKGDVVHAFFSAATTDSVRASMLDKYQIQYIFYGPAQASIGGYNPGASSFLSKVYENPTVAVYRVALVTLAGNHQ